MAYLTSSIFSFNELFPVPIKNCFLNLCLEIFEISSFGAEEYRVLAEKAVKKIPSLEPAIKNDYPVAISYSFPVVFNKK